MASSGNFPLWSPLIKDSGSLSQGNTRFTGATNNRGAMTSFAIPSGTKFYVELLVKQANYYNIVFGIANPEFNLGAYDESDASLNGFIFSGYDNNDWRTNALVNGSRQGWNSLSDDTTSLRVMALTINRVDNEIKCYLDNTLIGNGTISISATETYHLVCAFAGGANANIHMNINCGHDASGAGDFTSGGGNADANGFGDFQNSPPSGFLALSSANLPIGTGIDPAGEDGADENPTKQFFMTEYLGNLSNRTITTENQADLILIRHTNFAQNWYVVDSNRGITNNYYTKLDTNAAEATFPQSNFQSIGSTSVGISSGTWLNSTGAYYQMWMWHCNSGTTSSDSSGDITVTRQTNDASKFSICTWTGNGSSGSTIAHGLGVKPAMTWIKKRNATASHNCWHQGYNNGDYDSFGEPLGNAAWYANQGSNGPFSAAPGTDYLTLTAYAQVNGSSDTYVGYFWADVDGMQKFGNYVGNGDADGPFIYLGFKPRMIFIKRTDSTGNWEVRDTLRDTYNPLDSSLVWDTNAAEVSDPVYYLDVLSNGFKIRTTSTNYNASGGDYVYGAWADVPAKYPNTF